MQPGDLPARQAAKLRADGPEVLIDHRRRNIQRPGNLLGRHMPAEAIEDLQLPLGQGWHFERKVMIDQHCRPRSVATDVASRALTASQHRCLRTP